MLISYCDNRVCFVLFCVFTFEDKSMVCLTVCILLFWILVGEPALDCSAQCSAFERTQLVIAKKEQ